MANMWTKLSTAILCGIALSVLLWIVLILAGPGFDAYFTSARLALALRWLHVMSAILWLGLLYYFNLVQIPAMARLPDEQKPAVGKVIAPLAWFWFRRGAEITLLSGLLLAWLSGYLADALMLGLRSGVGYHAVIGAGMWLGIVLWANVFFVIWPAQKIALGLTEADAGAKAAAARRALIFARINTALSFPMLLCMVGAQNGLV